MRYIPYGKHSISDEDIQAVVEVLRSDWITQGKVIEDFEKSVAQYCGVKYAVAVSSGTAALHLAALAAGFGSGDEVITSPITFVATANSIIYSGATPVFADIDPETICINPREIERKLTVRTKGIIPVHFAGQPCNMAEIQKISKEHNLIVIEDAAHAIGASYMVNGKKYRIGSCSHSAMTIFSFHPVKHITTGEGGIITTNSYELSRKLKMMRSHGITKEPALLSQQDGPWYYEQQLLGFNYRITDFQCALGLSQLKKLDDFVSRRRDIVARYNKAFSNEDDLLVPHTDISAYSSYHIYILQLRNLNRLTFFNLLAKKGLGVNVHYIPVHLQPYYVKHFGYKTGDYQHSEAYYKRAVTLPLFPAMSDGDVNHVIETVLSTLREMKA